MVNIWDLTQYKCWYNREVSPFSGHLFTCCSNGHVAFSPPAVQFFFIGIFGLALCSFSHSPVSWPIPGAFGTLDMWLFWVSVWLVGSVIVFLSRYIYFKSKTVQLFASFVEVKKGNRPQVSLSRECHHCHHGKQSSNRHLGPGTRDSLTEIPWLSGRTSRRTSSLICILCFYYLIAGFGCFPTMLELGHRLHISQAKNIYYLYIYKFKYLKYF